ncbi:MAG: FecR domain-containing protein [Myxococcota bacterium]
MTAPIKKGSDRLAEALRKEPPKLDDIARARVERALLSEAARVRSESDLDPESLAELPAEVLRELPPAMPDRAPVESRRVPKEAASGGPASRGRLVPYGVAAGVLAAAAAVLAVVWSGDGPATNDGAAGIAEAAASFEVFDGGVRASQGELREGQRIDTEVGQRVEVRVGAAASPLARVGVAPESRVRFVGLHDDSIALRLEQGAVDVEFHPVRQGEQRFTVDTSSARVEVVGTVFRVEVDGLGATTVRVQDGLVRVTPTATGGTVRVVGAGEETTVGAEVVALEPESGSAGSVAQDEETLEEAATEEGEVGETSEADGSPPAGSQRSDIGPREPSARGDRDEGGARPADTEGIGERAAPDDPLLIEGLSVDARFDLARALERSGEGARARHVLYGIARAPVSSAHRVNAWTLVAESWANDRDYRQAAEAYRRASRAGGQSLAGLNALYALARLRGQMGDRSAAVVAYQRYLEAAPEGPHAPLARDALCRLGEVGFCR